MNVSKTLWRPVSAFLAISLATACQTQPLPSSSVLNETVRNAVAIEHDTLCKATRPGNISKVAFDASPLEARVKMTRDVEAWAEVCTDG